MITFIWSYRNKRIFYGSLTSDSKWQVNVLHGRSQHHLCSKLWKSIHCKKSIGLINKEFSLYRAYYTAVWLILQVFIHVSMSVEFSRSVCQTIQWRLIRCSLESNSVSQRRLFWQWFLQSFSLSITTVHFYRCSNI